MRSRTPPTEASRIQYKWTVLTVTTVGVLMAGIDSRIVIVGQPVTLGTGAVNLIYKPPPGLPKPTAVPKPKPAVTPPPPTPAPEEPLEEVVP